MNQNELQSLVATMKQFRKEVRLRMSLLHESNAVLAEEIRQLKALLAKAGI